MRRLVAMALGLALWLSAQTVTAQSTAGLGGDGASASFAACADRESWGTSTRYLRDTARCAWGASDAAEAQRRVALVEDIYIKGWSFALINKIAFWLAILLAVLVLVWPSLSVLVPEPRASPDAPPDSPAPAPSLLRRVVTASAVQTSVTALAALSFAFYAHYKGNQLRAENLMRQVIFAESLDAALVDRVVAEIREMDAGFGFTTLKSLSAGGS